jgi:hypothetical protein
MVQDFIGSLVQLHHYRRTYVFAGAMPRSSTAHKNYVSVGQEVPLNHKASDSSRETRLTTDQCPDKLRPYRSRIEPICVIFERLVSKRLTPGHVRSPPAR